MLRRIITLAKFILLCLILGPLLALAVQNSQPVPLSLAPLPYEVQIPLSMLAVLAFGAGVICCGISIRFKQRHVRRELSRMKRRADALDNEVAGLKHESKRQAAMTPSVPAP